MNYRAPKLFFFLNSGRAFKIRAEEQLERHRVWDEEAVCQIALQNVRIQYHSRLLTIETQRHVTCLLSTVHINKASCKLPQERHNVKLNPVQALDMHMR